MSFQWLQMRITEERERRERERVIMERLPRAIEELHSSLSACVETYTQEFGSQAADAVLAGLKIRVAVRDVDGDRWVVRSKVEVNGDLTLPGFVIERADVEP